MSTSDFRTLTSFPLEITWTVQNLGVTSAILEDKLLLFSFLQKNQKNLLKKTKRCIEKSLVKRVFWICYHEKMMEEEEAPMTNSLIPWSWTALEIASATSSDSSTIISNWTFRISQDFRFLVAKHETRNHIHCEEVHDSNTYLSMSKHGTAWMKHFSGFPINIFLVNRCGRAFSWGWNWHRISCFLQNKSDGSL